MQLSKMKSRKAFKRIDDLKYRLKKSDGKGFTIGVHDGSAVHKASGNGLKIYQLAAIQYNGSTKVRIPPRPWIIISDILHNRRFRNTFAREFSQYLKGLQSLTTTLHKYGTVRIELDKKVFGSHHLIRNAQSTVDQKGKNNPLIESGELLEHITIEYL